MLFENKPIDVCTSHSTNKLYQTLIVTLNLIVTFIFELTTFSYKVGS